MLDDLGFVERHAWFAAFEGGGVRCGMPALEGAIESVRLDERGAAAFSVIGGGRALGICGSGIIDLLAALLASGHMNELGRLADGEVDRFVVDPASGVSLHESDISELAQDINFIGEMFESLAREAEEQLVEHTRHITQKTRSLAILYDVAASMNV